MNGGYLMVSKTDTKLYEKLNNALTIGKPVLWYEDENTCYYIDTITKSGTDIVLTKGGKTITIESDGDITESGDISTLMEDIKDKNGNLRFVEGEGTLETISGVTFTYNKWSLSGTHLMIVLAGNVVANTTIDDNTKLSTYILPKYIVDKIVPISAYSVIGKKFEFIKENEPWTINDVLLHLDKNTNDELYVKNNSGSQTFTYNCSFRLQFDLLIDNE